MADVSPQDGARVIPLYGALPLASVRSWSTAMETDVRRALVEQTIVVLEDCYAHLRMKESSLAVAPVQAARVLLKTMAYFSESDFVEELLQIYRSLGDLHTLVTLPAPWNNLQAVLPFMVEEYVDENMRPRYIVTKISDLVDLGRDFVRGVEVTHWNGVATERFVRRLAQHTFGANPAARHRNVIHMLTSRSLAFEQTPPEDWATVTYRSGRGLREMSVPWLVLQRTAVGESAGSLVDGRALVQGMDARALDVQRTRKQLFGPQRSMHLSPRKPRYESVRTYLPENLLFRVLPGRRGSFGHLRIWNFEVSNIDAFVHEVQRLAGMAPKQGLVIDVRGNPGGIIPAGERILQLFTSRRIRPQPVQFRNTPLNLRTASLEPSLEPWRRSLWLAELTGEAFSQGVPMTGDEEANQIGRVFAGPLVLVVDALCYSACDFFAAGFQDHRIGPILGVDSSTGAGGANVWPHSYMVNLWRSQGDSPFADLAPGAEINVAMRRSVRVGPNAGIPVEGLGTAVDRVHSLTRNDLLNNNEDLLAHAESLFRDTTVR